MTLNDSHKCTKMKQYVIVAHTEKKHFNIYNSYPHYFKRGQLWFCGESIFASFLSSFCLKFWMFFFCFRKLRYCFNFILHVDKWAIDRSTWGLVSFCILNDIEFIWFLKELSNFYLKPWFRLLCFPRRVINNPIIYSSVYAYSACFYF